MRSGCADPITVLGIYPHPAFWSMGEGKGAPSFLLAPLGLVRAGHRVVLVMPAGDAPPGRSEYEGIELVRYGNGPGSVLENPEDGRVPRFFRRVQTYLSYRRVAKREALIVAREVSPDVVIGYDEHAAPVAREVAERLGVPNVSRFFGTYLLRYLGNLPALYYHFVPVIAYRTPASYVVINDDGSGGDRVARRLGVPSERIRFWRNGVDRDLYREGGGAEARAALLDRFGLPESAKLLFTLARLVREKHVERLVRAMPSVLSEHPETHLLVLGDGPDRGRIEREIERLGIGNAVRVVGAVERSELPDYLNGCDLFVAASDRTNGANPTFEAMVCARPVVVLGTGTTEEVVEDGVNGFLVPEAEPERLGVAIAEALGDDAKSAEIGHRGREWALRHLPTWEDRQRMEVELIELAVREA